MGKIGYAPKWGDIHTKAIDEYRERQDDTTFVSKKFTNVNDALEWLNEAYQVLCHHCKSSNITVIISETDGIPMCRGCDKLR